MNILKSNKLNFTVALLMGCSVAFAQKGATKDEPVGAPGDAPVNDQWKPSLVEDGTYDRVPHKGIPIPWQHVREADVLWSKKVWREIDTREKQNIAFRYQGDENTGGGMFIEILIDGIKKGKIVAYSTYDDRFTSKLTKEQVMESVSPKDTKMDVEDPLTGQMVSKVIHHDFDPNTVSKYRIREEWFFDRNQGKMLVRIVGIAPMKDEYDENGNYKTTAPMFWLHYPDIRPTLANYEVFNPSNEVYRYTWDEFFEARQFSSKITKVSNPLDSRFEDVFGTDARGKMESLYESQQNATEIFNKEHDMWVY